MKDQIEDIATTINYGLFLQVLPLIIDFSIQSKKTNVTGQLQILLDSFHSSLSKEEKVSFQEQLDLFLEKKWTEFENELKKQMTPEEVSQVFELLEKTFLRFPASSGGD